MNGPLEAILSANPSASTDEIAEAITGYIEKCITDTVKSLPPTHIPSPVQARLTSMVAKRRKKAKHGSHLAVSGDESFLLELRHLHGELNGHFQDVTGAVQLASPSGLGGIYDGASNSAADATGPRPLRNEEDTSMKRPAQPTFQPYSNPFRPSNKELAIRGSLEPGIRDLVASNPLFEQIIKSVESDLRSFAWQRNLPLVFDFMFAKDPEYPNWKRYVVALDTPLDFDGKMSFWTQVDTRVREDLRHLAEMNPEFAEQIKNISSNFFIHMEL